MLQSRRHAIHRHGPSAASRLLRRLQQFNHSHPDDQPAGGAHGPRGDSVAYTVRTVTADGVSVDSAAVTAEPFRAICLADVAVNRIPAISGEETDTTVASSFGSQSGLSLPFVAVDGAHHEIFAANRSLGTVTVYADDSQGDAAPLRTLNGGAGSVVYDAANDQLIVSGDTSIRTYPRTASGTTAPGARITSTAIDAPFGLTAIAYDPNHDEVLVAGANNGESAIFAFPASSTGQTAPSRMMKDAEGLSSPSGISIDAANKLLYVTNVSDNVFAFSSDFGANVSVLPVSKINGSSTNLASGVSSSVAFDAASGRIAVSSGQHLVLFAAGASGNATPLSTTAPA